MKIKERIKKSNPLLIVILAILGGLLFEWIGAIIGGIIGFVLNITLGVKQTNQPKKINGI